MTTSAPRDARTPTLFQALLGPSFFHLPEAVRRLHAGAGVARHAGRASVERGTHPLARLCARIAHLPPALTDAPLQVVIDADAGGETWRRDFDGHPMRSRLHARDGVLHERLGALRLRFHLYLHDGALHWRVAGVRALRVLPLPVRWFEGVRCAERGHDGRYAFQVEAVLPVVGLVVRYHGWLVPDAGVADGG